MQRFMRILQVMANLQVMQIQSTICSIWVVSVVEWKGQRHVELERAKTCRNDLKRDKSKLFIITISITISFFYCSQRQVLTTSIQGLSTHALRQMLAITVKE